MTIYTPSLVVDEWVRSGQVSATATDEEFLAFLDERGQYGEDWRRDALSTMKLIRHEALTGDPF